MNHWRNRTKLEVAARTEGKQVVHQGSKTYIDGKLVYDSDQQEDQLKYTEEEKTKLWMYASALDELSGESIRFNANFNLWQLWDNAQRLWWIAQIEKQAQAGRQTIGIEVVARAVEIRMTRSRT